MVSSSAMQRLVLAGVTLLGAAACGKSTSKPAPATVPSDAAVAVARDAAAASDDAAPADAAAPDDALAADAPAAAARLAVVRVALDHTFVDTYELAGGALHKLTSADVSHESMFSRELIWPDPTGPAVFRGGITERENAELYGTVIGERFTAIKPPGKGDVLRLLGSTTGEVWLERCAKWNPDNPDEEGCDVRRWYRLTPTPGTATKQPARLTTAADLVPAPAAPALKVRKVGDDFVLDCTLGGKRTTLLEGEQVYAAPTLRWLSAQPPIALVAIAYAGLGESPILDPTSKRLLRGCALDEEDTPMIEGPAGLWALPAGDATMGTTEWQIFLRGASIGTVPGVAIAFAGGAGAP